MQLVVLSVLDFDFAIAVRPLRGASNRNTSGSAGGYLFLSQHGARREDEWKSLRADSTIYPECCRRERGTGVALPNAANKIVRRTNPPYRTNSDALSG